MQQDARTAFQQHLQYNNKQRDATTSDACIRTIQLEWCWLYSNNASPYSGGDLLVTMGTANHGFEEGTGH
jgi:hypothetical protein